VVIWRSIVGQPDETVVQVVGGREVSWSPVHGRGRVNMRESWRYLHRAKQWWWQHGSGSSDDQQFTADGMRGELSQLADVN
jgi:hypothetical protein